MDNIDLKVDKARKAGYSDQQIQTFLGSKGIDYNFAAKPQGFAQNVATDFKQRAANTLTAQTSNQGLLSKGLQTVGQAAGFAGDLATEGIKAVTPQPVQDALGAGVQAVAGAAPVQNALSAYTSWATQNPEWAKNLEAAVNIGSLIPGVGAGAKGVETASRVAKGAVTGLKDVALGAKDLAVGARSGGALQDALDITRPALNKKDAISAFENAGKPGGITKTGKLGTYSQTAAPDQRAIQIAESVQGVVSKNKGPIDNIVAINDAIEHTSENVIKPFLEQNKVPFHFQDLRTYMQHTVQPEAGLKADPAAFKTYKRVTENILTNLNKTLKEKAAGAGDYLNQTDFNHLWDARKVLDQTIENELKIAPFGSPEYTGVRAAAVDVRNSFSNFIKESLANPGQMEKVNKLHDFANEATKRGIDAHAPEFKPALEAQLGITRTPEDIARADVFSKTMSQLNAMYEARGNIAEQNYKLLDKNALQRWLKQNPGKKKLLEYGLGGGAAYAGYKSVTQ